MKVLGLTGGISTGKSTVSRLLRDRGIPVVDADEIAHSVMRKGQWGYNRAVQALGQGILGPSGEIDRTALGEVAFSDTAVRKKLNAATHPAVAFEVVKRMAWYWLTCTFLVVLDMPLLLETGTNKVTSPCIVVTCDHATQLKRLMKRDKCSKEAAEAKIAAQMPMEAKVARADFIIDNSGSLQETELQVDRIMTKVQQGAVWQGIITCPVATVGLLGAVIYSKLHLS